MHLSKGIYRPVGCRAGVNVKTVFGGSKAGIALRMGQIVGVPGVITATPLIPLSYRCGMYAGMFSLPALMKGCAGYMAVSDRF